MHFLKVSILYFFVLISCKLFAQEIKNVDFSISKENKMIVSYDLTNCPKKKMFNLKMKIKTTNGKEITPISIEGDLIQVKEGFNKQIEWDVLKDVSDLKDEIYVTLEITKSYYSKIVGGPSNAFLSVLLPGLGDIGVNRYSSNTGSNGWFYVTSLFLGSAIYTYYLDYSYKQDYAKYHLATLQSDMDFYYNSANKKYRDYQIMLGVTGTIWIADILYVLIKGASNRKSQLYERNLTYQGKNSNINLSFNASPNTVQIGLVKKF